MVLQIRCINLLKAMRYLIIGLLMLLLISCERSGKSYVISILQEWENKQILFPPNIAFTIQGKDTVVFPLNSNFKILTYIDSKGCLSCELKLAEWKRMINKVNSLMGDSVRFVFLFSPDRVEDAFYTLRGAKFTYPVCLDEKKRMNQLNRFPAEMAFQTFLLDKDNRVLAIGNPIHNPEVKDLYFKIIQGEKVEKEDESEIVITELNIDKTSISLGNFDWQNEQKTTFILKNKGSKPLVIQYVNTSCGCTKVSYSQEPVQPEGEITLNVTYKADHPGHFSKTITVYCNTKLSPIKLTISGNAQ